MFPVMNGTIELGNLPDAVIHANSSDIIRNLKFGERAYFKAANDRWALPSDIIKVNQYLMKFGYDGRSSIKFGFHF